MIASILSIFVVWGIFLIGSYYFNESTAVLNNLKNIFIFGLPLLNRPINEIIYVSIIFFIGLIGVVSIKSNLHQESIQTRSLLNFIILLSFCSFTMSMILYDYYYIFLPVSAMGFSFILGHCFTLRKSNLFSYIFLIFIAANILYIVSNLFLHAV